MDILSKFTNLLSKKPFHLKEGDRILVAASSGSDSTCLIHLLKRSGFQIGLVHCNYHLRKKQSIEDQKFLDSLAQALNIPFYCRQFNKEELQSKTASTQMKARELRYTFFEEIRQKFNYDWIATAHHIEDHIETSLMNWIEGCGVKGLRGIPAKRGQIIRPLLTFKKTELTQFLITNDLTYRHDESNDRLDYKRNKIRHQIIPLLQQIEPGLIKNMRFNRQRMIEMEAIQDSFIENWLSQITHVKNEQLYISLDKLDMSNAPLTLLNAILSPFSYTPGQIDQIYQTRYQTSGAIFYSPKARLLRDRAFLVLQKESTHDNYSLAKVIHTQDQLQTTWNNTRIDVLTNDISVDYKHQVIIKVDALQFPIQLRYRKMGDVFYPRGMNGKKKVAKFMKDLKLDQFAKEKIPILVNGNGDIIWIIGLALDKRYQGDPSSPDHLYLKHTKI